MLFLSLNSYIGLSSILTKYMKLFLVSKKYLQKIDDIQAQKKTLIQSQKAKIVETSFSDYKQ